MASYDTQNVIASKTGTGWTVDVTACQLDADIQLKDFIVFFTFSPAPPLQQDNSLFTKLTPTSLQYTGPAIATATVEVRRKTPIGPYRPVNYLSSISSNDYNQEIERISRRAAEYEVSGVGSTGGFDSEVLDVAYGITWNGDTLNAPSRNAVYDKIESVIANYIAADTVLQGNINTLTTNLGATNTALTALNTRVTNVETVNTSQGNDITAILAKLGVGAFVWTGASAAIGTNSLIIGGSQSNVITTLSGVSASTNTITTIANAGDYIIDYYVDLTFNGTAAERASQLEINLMESTGGAYSTIHSVGITYTGGATAETARFLNAKLQGRLARNVAAGNTYRLSVSSNATGASNYTINSARVTVTRH